MSTKLIGFVIDTNQFTSPVIENENQARLWLQRLVKEYGEDITDFMNLASWENRCFSTFARPFGITLKEYLEGNVKL